MRLDGFLDVGGGTGCFTTSTSALGAGLLKGAGGVVLAVGAGEYGDEHPGLGQP